MHGQSSSAAASLASASQVGLDLVFSEIGLTPVSTGGSVAAGAGRTGTESPTSSRFRTLFSRSHSNLASTEMDKHGGMVDRGGMDHRIALDKHGMDHRGGMEHRIGMDRAGMDRDRNGQTSGSSPVTPSSTTSMSSSLNSSLSSLTSGSGGTISIAASEKAEKAERRRHQHQLELEASERAKAEKAERVKAEKAAERKKHQHQLDLDVIYRLEAHGMLAPSDKQRKPHRNTRSQDSLEVDAAGAGAGERVPALPTGATTAAIGGMVGAAPPSPSSFRSLFGLDPSPSLMPPPHNYSPHNHNHPPHHHHTHHLYASNDTLLNPSTHSRVTQQQQHEDLSSGKPRAISFSSVHSNAGSSKPRSTSFSASVLKHSHLADRGMSLPTLTTHLIDYNENPMPPPHAHHHHASSGSPLKAGGGGDRPGGPLSSSPSSSGSRTPVSPKDASSWADRDDHQRRRRDRDHRDGSPGGGGGGGHGSTSLLSPSSSSSSQSAQSILAHSLASAQSLLAHAGFDAPPSSSSSSSSQPLSPRGSPEANKIWEKCVKVTCPGRQSHIVDVSRCKRGAEMREVIMGKFRCKAGERGLYGIYGLDARGKLDLASEVDDETLGEICTGSNVTLRTHLVLKKRAEAEADIASKSDPLFQDRPLDSPTHLTFSSALPPLPPGSPKSPKPSSIRTQAKSLREEHMLMDELASGRTHSLPRRLRKAEAFFGERPPSDLICENLEVFFPSISRKTSTASSIAASSIASNPRVESLSMLDKSVVARTRSEPADSPATMEGSPVVLTPNSMPADEPIVSVADVIEAMRYRRISRTASQKTSFGRRASKTLRARPSMASIVTSHSSSARSTLTSVAGDDEEESVEMEETPRDARDIRPPTRTVSLHQDATTRSVAEEWKEKLALLPSCGGLFLSFSPEDPGWTMEQKKAARRRSIRLLAAGQCAPLEGPGARRVGSTARRKAAVAPDFHAIQEEGGAGARRVKGLEEEDDDGVEHAFQGFVVAPPRDEWGEEEGQWTNLRRGFAPRRKRSNRTLSSIGSSRRDVESDDGDGGMLFKRGPRPSVDSSLIDSYAAVDVVVEDAKVIAEMEDAKAAIIDERMEREEETRPLYHRFPRPPSIETTPRRPIDAVSEASASEENGMRTTPTLANAGANTPSTDTAGATAGSLNSAIFTPVDERPTHLEWMRGDLIGKGSYGRVYFGVNLTTKEVMAVKQVEMVPVPERRGGGMMRQPVVGAAERGGDQVKMRQKMVDALRMEILLLRDLDHQNVVQYLGEFGVVV
ncbi:hypothetical protein HK101_010174 [Irineochytrium annulatum]|nr:hypothetical protein HK101_010174 [Irineochytrium annulatum]